MTKTPIEWTEESWNPIVGCSILTPGCTNCYAMKMAARIEAINREARETERASGKKRSVAARYDGTTKIVNGAAVWTGKMAQAPENILLAPLKRKKPTTYFVNSMGDLFHESVPDEWIDQVFAVMALCPQHTFQVLTKRAERMRDYVNAVVSDRTRFTKWAARGSDIARSCDRASEVPAHWPLDNVWLGVSTERQKEADERIPLLLQTPAAVRFVSAEPLLGPIDLTRIGLSEKTVNHLGFYTNATTGHPQHSIPRLDWVIVGGESGPGARPMHPQWVRALRDQCDAAEVCFFFKQWGEWKPLNQFKEQVIEGSGVHAVIDRDGRYLVDHDIADPPGKVFTFRVGKSRAGRLLDGVTHDDMPGQPDHVITPPARRAVAAE